MDLSVSPKDEICLLRVCHHISTGLYCSRTGFFTFVSQVYQLPARIPAVRSHLPFEGPFKKPLLKDGKVIVPEILMSYTL